MMKLKSRYKSFVSSLKKAILKLKGKAVLCAKQSKPTTEIANVFINNYIKETQVYPTIPLICLDLISTINNSIQRINKIIVKWLYSVFIINRTTKIEFLISTFNPPPKYNIQTHLI